MSNLSERSQHPISEFEPRSKDEELRNRSIVQRIVNILQLGKSSQGVPFVLKKIDDAERGAYLYVAFSEEDNEDYPFGFGEEKVLQHPTYALEFDPDDEITTPYGKMNPYVIDGENNLYMLHNIYYFDLSAKAAKYEGILQLADDEESLKDEIYTMDIEPTKVPITISGGDARIVELDGEDYDKVLTMLSEFEQGKFTSIRPNVE